MNICIIAHLAYGAITGGSNGHAGGVEYQTSLLARWLSSKGHRVNFLTWNEGGSADDEYIDNVRVIKMCKQDEGLIGVRFFYPRWTSLNKALRKADAELYYHNCAEYATGQIALWCNAHGKSFIYSVASDAECELISAATEKQRDKLFFRYGIRNADQIIVQSQKQQQLLHKNFGLESIILPMPSIGPLDDQNQRTHVPEQGQYKVLWVGRIDKEKRLELLLDIAERLPEISFDVVGKPSHLGAPYFQNLLAKATALPNVKLLGMIPRNRMANLYLNSDLLCCTSLYEGFPNTFIEAWSYGLPIVSTFDPDNIIISKHLGIFAENCFELISGITTILESPTNWQVMSTNARRYYDENHALDKSMLKFEHVFVQTIGANSCTAETSK